MVILLQIDIDYLSEDFFGSRIINRGKNIKKGNTMNKWSASLPHDPQKFLLTVKNLQILGDLVVQHVNLLKLMVLR